MLRRESPALFYGIGNSSAGGNLSPRVHVHVGSNRIKDRGELATTLQMHA